MHQRGYTRYDVFRDWLDLMLYALERDDDSYLEVVNKYSNDRPKGEREIDLYTEAFGLLQEGMAETNTDLLGVVYEELGHASDQFGQHFTPHSLCDVMAEMSLLDVSKEKPSVADPACGSGRLLIYAAKKLDDGEFYGQDKDITCTKMTALNLCFFNVDGYAVHGDTLLNERKRVWRTKYTPMGGVIRELESDEFGDPYEQAKQEVDQTIDNEDIDSNGEAGRLSVEDELVDLRSTRLTEFEG